MTRPKLSVSPPPEPPGSNGKCEEEVEHLASGTARNSFIGRPPPSGVVNQRGSGRQLTASRSLRPAAPPTVLLDHPGGHRPICPSSHFSASFTLRTSCITGPRATVLSGDSI